MKTYSVERALSHHQRLVCPLLSGPKSLLFWIMKEFGNRQEAQSGRDYRQGACGGDRAGAGRKRRAMHVVGSRLPSRPITAGARQADLAGGSPGKLLSPARRRRCVDHARGELAVLLNDWSAGCLASIDRRSARCRAGRIMRWRTVSRQSAPPSIKRQESVSVAVKGLYNLTVQLHRPTQVASDMGRRRCASERQWL